MSELQNFKDDLGRELVAAAHRRNLATARQSSKPSRTKPAVALAFALVTITIGVISLADVLDTHPAAADAIEITQLQEEIEIRVVDIVTDPEAVTAKLEDQLGIVAEMLAVPAPPALVGQIKSVGNIGRVEVDVSSSSEGLVELIILPIGFSGILTIEYGRQAAPGELYNMSTTDIRCEQFYGLTKIESLGQIQDQFGPSLRFEAVAADHSTATDVEADDIPGHYRIADILPLSADSYLITYAEDPSTEYVPPNCQ